ncbi:MAG: translesion error-prone DNA polymerase V autoproteolytic subunit [Candidatus Omnitrophica bacterium]|nr:translesion error-prone DNA polymerase V autoproteolytic subunit [Candidatus Omnitrophota bacterium]
MGVVQGCVANWEGGRREPKVSELARLARVLKVSAGDLAGVTVPGALTLYGDATVPIRRMPLYTSHISAGFPSPADDYIEKRLNLNDLVIKNPASTFFVRVSGDSMQDAGINHGDILVVDRSRTPGNSSIVIAVLNGELTVKRIRKTRKKLYLVPENEEYSEIEITGEEEFVVWGVVTNVIHPV